MTKADIEDDDRPGTTEVQSAELRESGRRNSSLVPLACRTGKQVSSRQKNCHFCEGGVIRSRSPRC